MIAELFKLLMYKGLERFGRYYSIYRGFVIDNNDPNNYSRLQLKVPHVYGDTIMKYWAWQKNCFSGPNYGCQIIPRKGELVWVEFEMGDPRRPVWSYGHFGKTGGVIEKPEELNDINIFWFRTPGGITIELDDNTGEIRITSNGGTQKLSADKIQFNEGENGGLVKIDPLVEKVNNLESKVNSLIQGFNNHVHPDPTSGITGIPSNSGTIAPLATTQKTELENPIVLH